MLELFVYPANCLLGRSRIAIDLWVDFVGQIFYNFALELGRFLTGVLNSLCVTVDLCAFPVKFISFYFRCFVLLQVYMFIVTVSSRWIELLSSLKVFSVSNSFLYSEVYILWYKYRNIYFLIKINVCVVYLFWFFSFNPPMSLKLKWASWEQRILELWPLKKICLFFYSCPNFPPLSSFVQPIPLPQSIPTLLSMFMGH